jgi:hypothetical protein
MKVQKKADSTNKKYMSGKGKRKNPLLSGETFFYLTSYSIKQNIGWLICSFNNLKLPLHKCTGACL